MKLNNTEIIQYLRHYIKVLAIDLLQFNPTLLTATTYKYIFKVCGSPPPPPPPLLLSIYQYFEKSILKLDQFFKKCNILHRFSISVHLKIYKSFCLFVEEYNI